MNARTRAIAATAALMLGFVLLVSGCTEVRNLPQIDQPVKQFWLGVSGTVPQQAVDHTLPENDVPLDDLVRALDSSRVEVWNHQNPGTPSMLVLLVLEDDSEVWMAFNGSFGAEYAEVAMRRVVDGRLGEYEQYWVHSQGLVKQAAKLGLDMLSVADMGLVDPEGTWLLQ